MKFRSSFGRLALRPRLRYPSFMRAIVRPRPFAGCFRVPASKSHTIRRLLVAALADGETVIERPLDSLDARSCAAACRVLGARVDEESQDGVLSRWTVRGVGAGAAGGFPSGGSIDVGNSGTTLYLAMAIAALSPEPVRFDGDDQIRRRSASPLLDALRGLGARAESAPGGCAPLTVSGPWRGGRVSLECPTSQYLSALLLAAPLAPAGAVTEIDVPLLNERPYVEMTLGYLRALGADFEAAPDLSHFRVPGGQRYAPLSGPVPADFSSAAFPACAAAVTGGPVTLLGLDPDDAQGDKAVFDMLYRMGCRVEWGVKGDDGCPVTVSRPGALSGAEFDLNATPDALPALAATACFAGGETGLVNVANARIKETDRISVMCRELRRLGASVEELSDGLIVNGSAVRGMPPLRGGSVRGHGDHRVVMALAVAALGAAGPVEIDTAESADVTYPGFLRMVGAELQA